MLRFSDITKERFAAFRRIRRAYWSLWILGVSFVVSLFCGFWVNDRPIVLSYNNELFFPAFKFYPDRKFGGSYGTEADYLKLAADPEFASKQGWMVLPPIPHDPLRHYLDLQGNPPYAPSTKHWLGTDSGGRDVLARLIYGFRISMLFALLLTIATAVLGIVVGGVQGYLGGAWDIFMQRVIEVWSALPFLYVVILMGSVFGRNFAVLLGVMTLFSWIGLSYYMRGEFYRTKSMNYVRVARALGLGPARIFFRHILPNSLTPAITILPFTLIGGIGSLTALDFLGFGLQPPTPSWGELMKQGLDNLHAPWIAISATAALFVTLLLATFIGEGAREAFDPKSESRGGQR